MQIPKNSTVKDFKAASLRSLLVGRFDENQANFFAIRTEIINTAGTAPYMIILNASIDDEERPYICDPHGGARVFDLGTDWLIDVSINFKEPSQPARFGNRAGEILVRSGASYFLRLKDAYYLDMDTGNLVSSLPDNENVVGWTEFTIHLPQPNEPGPGTEVFKWPE